MATVYRELNGIFEVVGLLELCHHLTAHSVEKLYENMATEAQRQQFLPLLERYVGTFLNGFKESPESAFFFKEMDDGIFYHMLFLLLANNPSWLDSMEGLTDVDVRQGIGDVLFEEPVETLAEVVAAFEETPLSPKACWKLTLMWSEPLRYVRTLVNVVLEHFPAYEAAKLEIAAELEPLLDNFEPPSGEFLKKFTLLVGTDYDFYPVLCRPMTFSLSYNGDAYCGLFLNVELDSGEDKQNLLQSLKLLGDGSKFQMLLSLQNDSKFNLQLAKELGISAATASHHMTALLAQGLVTAKKRDGKVFYALDKGQIRAVVAQLRRF